MSLSICPDRRVVQWLEKDVKMKHKLEAEIDQRSSKLSGFFLPMFETVVVEA